MGRKLWKLGKFYGPPCHWLNTWGFYIGSLEELLLYPFLPHKHTGTWGYCYYTASMFIYIERCCSWKEWSDFGAIVRNEVLSWSQQKHVERTGENKQLPGNWYAIYIYIVYIAYDSRSYIYIIIFIYLSIYLFIYLFDMFVEPTAKVMLDLSFSPLQDFFATTLAPTSSRGCEAVHSGASGISWHQLKGHQHPIEVRFWNSVVT